MQWLKRCFYYYNNNCTVNPLFLQAVHLTSVNKDNNPVNSTNFHMARNPTYFYIIGLEWKILRKLSVCSHLPNNVLCSPDF